MEVDWHFALVIQQITQLCHSLDFVSFMHIPYEWNGVADCLAKWASKNVLDWNIIDRRMLPPDLSQKLVQFVGEDKVL